MIYRFPTLGSTFSAALNKTRKSVAIEADPQQYFHSKVRGVSQFATVTADSSQADNVEELFS